MLTVLIFDGCISIYFCTWTKHALRQVIYLKYDYLAPSDIVFTHAKHISFCTLLSNLEINSIPRMPVKGKQTNAKIHIILTCNRGRMISWIFLTETPNTPLSTLPVLVVYLLGLPRSFIVNFWLHSLMSQVEQNILTLVFNDYIDEKMCFFLSLQNAVKIASRHSSQLASNSKTKNVVQS